MSTEFSVRVATPDDAAAMLANMREVADEPDNGILQSHGEPLRSVEEQRKMLVERLAMPNSISFVAEANGRQIGHLHCAGGTRQATQHTVSLGIMVIKEWRNKGVGTALMQRAVEWARSNPMVKRLDLDVMTMNARASHLYEKMGFEPEGIKRQIYFKDGRFVDALMMSIVFER